MARESTYRKGVGAGKAVNFNMTPMIDCTFQLIIFFILASQTANEAYAKHIQPARPTESQAVRVQDMNVPNRIVVNVVSAAATMDKVEDPLLWANAGWYEIKRKRFDVGDLDPLVELIKNKKDAAEAAGETSETDEAKQFFIEVRADKRVNWQDVAPVIRAGILAGVRKMNITALTAQK